MLKKNRHSHGFTLIEILVVVSIISLLATLVVISFRNNRLQTQATKMVIDFSIIRKAWIFWRIDTGENFVLEGIYGSSNTEAPCHDEPILSDTDLSQNVSGKISWSGPYINPIPKDPFGREYSYDNDGDLWNPPSGKWGGVNAQSQWCNREDGNRYLELAPRIDKIFDNGDGNNLGSFRWDNNKNKGSYSFLITSIFNK